MYVVLFLVKTLSLGRSLSCYCSQDHVKCATKQKDPFASSTARWSCRSTKTGVMIFNSSRSWFKPLGLYYSGGAYAWAMCQPLARCGWKHKTDSSPLNSNDFFLIHWTKQYSNYVGLFTIWRQETLFGVLFIARVSRQANSNYAGATVTLAVQFWSSLAKKANTGVGYPLGFLERSQIPGNLNLWQWVICVGILFKNSIEWFQISCKQCNNFEFIWNNCVFRN